MFAKIERYVQRKAIYRLPENCDNLVDRFINIFLGEFFVKTLSLITIFLVGQLSYGYGGGGGGGRQPSPRTYDFKVTVINLTKGQPLTPPVIAIHKGRQSVLLHPSKPASDGLAVLATDGMTDGLVAELDNNNIVSQVLVGDGVIMPGQKAEFTFSQKESHLPIFSLFTMLARTNDAIAVANGRDSLTTTTEFDRRKKISFAQVYDAGVEYNSEDCAHIPAPPCNSPNSRPSMDGEGFIRPHEGLTLHGDLIGQRDAFANVAAKVIIERIN